MNTNKIVIVGGGSAGWMTAATLITAFPNKTIQVIESKDVPILGVGESTIGGIKIWTSFIGLEENNFFKETDASYKLSIKFTDFYKKDSGSFHYPFGVPISDDNRNPFFDWHLKKYFYPETEVEDFSRCIFPSTYLFENNRYSENNHEEFDSFNPQKDVAYHFDATKFGIWLKEFICIPRGVEHIQSTVIDIKTNENGIESLTLEDGEEVSADLFVDCTGFKSLLLGGALKEKFLDYSSILPNNRAWATRLKYKNKELELEGFTNCTAIENGWCWNIPLWSRLGTGYVYSDRYVSPEKAQEEFKSYLKSNKMIVPRTDEEIENLEFKDIKMRVGIHEKTFVKNVVAIGLSAGFIEPLESNGLFSVHEFLFKLVDILQREKINQFDRDMYNVSVRNLFDNFAKFVALHYALSHRDDTKYWQDLQNRDFSILDGDPYSKHLGYSDSFHNIVKRYMEDWEHPYGIHGITFIATGMNLFMYNKSRIENMSIRYGLNYKQMADKAISLWEYKKSRWYKNALNSPTLYEYLKNRFHLD